MPKVSVIIPFNNVENYIKECLGSVLNQTLTDIEVICVDDASDDGTLNIVKEFASKDSRIRLIELSERKGQGYARNRAIEIATGDYIGFVDSDDFVKPEMFELLYEKALENDNDIVMCQVSEYDDVTGQYIQSDYYSLAPLYSFGDRIFSAEDTKQVILDINVALWNKIYRRSYLAEIGEKFPEGFIYEDLPFFFGTYLPAKKVQIVWKDLYAYRVNRKNSTMQQFNNKILDRLPMVSLTYEKMKQTPFLADMKQSLQAWIINDLFHRYTLLKEHYQKEFFFLMKKVFQNLEIENEYDSYWKSVYHFKGYLLVMNNTFDDFNQKVFNEYLDIHKVEDRIRSSIFSRDELDTKISNVYLDIEKNYKYTEKLVDDLKYELSKTDLESKISNIEKVSEENLKEKFELLYSNIKDLSYVVHENNTCVFDNLAKLETLLLTKVSTDSEETKQLINKLLDDLKNEINSKIIDVQKENQKTIDEIQLKVERLTSKFDLYVSGDVFNKTIETIEQKYSALLELQNQKHEEEIALLKEQMIEMEQRITEQLDTPCKKIHKYIASRKKQCH